MTYIQNLGSNADNENYVINVKYDINCVDISSFVWFNYGRAIFFLNFTLKNAENHSIIAGTMCFGGE